MTQQLSTVIPPAGAWAGLRRFARTPVPAQRCELCGQALDAEHRHLVEPASRKLVCACEACAILFDRQAAAKYRRVPRRVESLDGFRLTDVQWNALGIPIGLAFFFNHSPSGKVMAVYPSPAGATESLLEFDAWSEIAEENPILSTMEPDTEALLVNRVRNAREYYLAPIDECYRLAGLLRTHWQGISGGSAVWREIGDFFIGLKQRSGREVWESRRR